MGVAERTRPPDFGGASETARPTAGSADATRGTAWSPTRPSDASDELTSNVAELPAVLGGAKFSMAARRVQGKAIRLITYLSVGNPCGIPRRPSP